MKHRFMMEDNACAIFQAVIYITGCKEPISCRSSISRNGMDSHKRTPWEVRRETGLLEKNVVQQQNIA
jgi:hypothetical protein